MIEILSSERLCSRSPTFILVPELIARFSACCRKHQDQGGARRRDEEGILVDRLRPGSRSGSAELEFTSKFQQFDRKLYIYKD